MRITVTFSLDDTEDRDLVRWLSQQPARQRSASIRDALRASIGRQEITLADVYREIQDLKRRGFVAAGPGQGPAADEPEDIAQALDSLGL